jgi:hypothetical protein
MEIDDDIQCKENLFNRPHRAEPESTYESLAIIQFKETPALQKALRALCMEFIDIFSKVATTAGVPELLCCQ